MLGSLPRALTMGCAMALMALPVAAPAQPSGFDSAYTDLNLDECSIIHSDDFGTEWACPGYKGIPVMLREGDLRFFVSYGLESTTEKAAEQTLPAFNYLGGKIEWRLSNRSGRFKPVATILRWFTDKGENDGDKPGQILVVTKVEPGNTCHIAYVDALLTPDANQVARALADELAHDFDCETDEITLVPD